MSVNSVCMVKHNQFKLFVVAIGTVELINPCDLSIVKMSPSNSTFIVVCLKTNHNNLIQRVSAFSEVGYCRVIT
jgi:hypothetical protein